MSRGTKPKGRTGVATHGQYNFVDMTGRRVGVLLVDSRMPNVNGNARWLCACDCGASCIVQGITLRAVLKQETAGERKRPYSCPACRPRRPATVARKATYRRVKGQ